MKRLASALRIAFGASYLQAQDSPLVAAAKASQHAKKSKKKIVITNETLARSGGHVSTATNAPAPLPKLPPETSVAAVKPATVQSDAAAEKKKHDAAERANAIYEGDDPEGIYEDPAKAEGRMQKNSPPAPQQPPTVQTQQPPTVQSQKPPAN